MMCPKKYQLLKVLEAQIRLPIIDSKPQEAQTQSVEGSDFKPQRATNFQPFFYRITFKLSSSGQTSTGRGKRLLVSRIPVLERTSSFYQKNNYLTKKNISTFSTKANRNSFRFANKQAIPVIGGQLFQVEEVEIILEQYYRNPLLHCIEIILNTSAEWNYVGPIMLKTGFVLQIYRNYL